MLLTVAQFRERVQRDLRGLIADLQAKTSRRTHEEEAAWRVSLPAVAETLRRAAVDDLHLMLGEQGNLAVEYRLPGSSQWADLVLLGRGGSGPGAVVVELKHWTTKGDKPGPEEGLMVRHGMTTLHPSDQVRGYVEYCRNFHAAVQDHEASVAGCVLFTRDAYFHSYRLAPNHDLERQFRCFFAGGHDAGETFGRFVSGLLTQPDPAFAEAFASGGYRQRRGFVQAIGDQLRDPKSSPFVLLDHQRRAHFLVRARVREALSRHDGKAVLLVVGPPGSGKSVVAARVWADLATDERVRGDLVVVTTSASQRSNWQHLFNEAAGPGAAGVVVGATGFTPASTGDFGSLRKQWPDAFGPEAKWRENVAMLRSLNGAFREGSRDDQFLVSLCDEAHALINPEHVEGRGQFGFATAFGPQAWHIIRCSRVTVFFLDPAQGFRDRENTTLDDLRKWAVELGAKVEEISLEGSQFRCGGSLAYVQAVDRLLGFEPCPGAVTAEPNAPETDEPGEEVVQFQAVAEDAPLEEPALGQGFAPFEIHWCGDLDELEAQLRQRAAEGGSVRLLASYARPWKTEGVHAPHGLPPDSRDFDFRWSRGGEERRWTRIWNHAPNGDYARFIQAPAGSAMAADPLAEVGCPYTVRGFDFDHVGLLWLGDLVRRGDRWRAIPELSHERGFSRAIRAAKRERDPDGPAHQRLARALMASYRILLTRPLKSLHLWCEDAETRDYLRLVLGG